jgi:putative toxin-antitoxin system antitoxin component (TIGR02293 family)
MQATANYPGSSPPITFDVLEQLRAMLGFTQSAMAEFIGISDKTYSRRAKEGTLQPAERLQIEMLQRIIMEARRVFEDDATAYHWISTDIVSLDLKRPIDHLHSIEGYERVKNTLGKIEYGLY